MSEQTKKAKAEEVEKTEKELTNEATEETSTVEAAEETKEAKKAEKKELPVCYRFNLFQRFGRIAQKIRNGGLVHPFVTIVEFKILV